MLGLIRKKTQDAPYLLQFVHAPHQLGGDRMQLQEVQAVERALQHVYDGGELRNRVG